MDPMMSHKNSDTKIVEVVILEGVLWKTGYENYKNAHIPCDASCNRYGISFHEQRVLKRDNNLKVLNNNTQHSTTPMIKFFQLHIGVSVKKEPLVNFLADVLDVRSTLKPNDILVFGWIGGNMLVWF
ncbi:hypothetical protein LXL04_011592 [Taraxacum kok-saghyz]